MTTTRASLPTAIAVVLGLLLPAAAFAQDMGHAGMQMPMSMPMPEKKPAKKKRANDGHATHEHSAATEPQSPAPQAQDMRGMQMPADAHAMHGMEAHGLAEPRTPIPVPTDADRAAALPPPGDHPVHDNTIQHYTLFDRLEGSRADGATAFEWEGRGWIGTDLNRLWLRTEGERRDGRTQDADLEVLYGHSVTTWWDVVAGVRHDFKPGVAQDFAAIGVMGMAPYKFEVAATAYLGQDGQTAARLEAEYETLLTNRLILQPLVEVNLYGQDDARRGIGSGLSTVEAGLRLRYEITRRFAPYIGVVSEHAFGRTADFRRAEGEDTHDTRLVAGVRIWF
ncbi:MAG: copper resistance protein B [Lysobacter sp.]|nr:copper resistance protein B [Lysobacter sp.]